MRKLLAALGAVVMVTASAGCGLGTAGGYSPSGTLAGPLEDVDLSGVSVAVGSKNFTEQLVLGKMAVELLASAGADVQDLTNIPGSSSSREALKKGDVTFSWEYTGTAWITYLGHDDPIPDEQGQFEAVKQEDAANGLVWLPPATMNNTYAFATPRAVAERLGVTTLSDIAGLPPEEQTFCIESEFANRNDGFQPLLETYEIPAPPGERTAILDTGAIYAATSDGTCNFGEVFATDGRIIAQDLVVLEDDRAFFPKYNLSAVVHHSLYDAHPEVEELFGPVTEAITDETMQRLNAEVDVEGKEPADVAWQWLQDEGFVTA